MEFLRRIDTSCPFFLFGVIRSTQPENKYIFGLTRFFKEINIDDEVEYIHTPCDRS